MKKRILFNAFHMNCVVHQSPGPDSSNFAGKLVAKDDGKRTRPASSRRPRRRPFKLNRRHGSRMHVHEQLAFAKAGQWHPLENQRLGTTAELKSDRFHMGC